MDSDSMTVDVSRPPLVLLSGVPGTGKSTFGRWLSETHGIMHLDIEHIDVGRYGLDEPWRQSTASPRSSPTPFVTALRRLHRPVAVDWGYPMAWLPFVMAMHDAGIVTWWFDGDRAAARNRFLARGTVSVRALDIQMGAIESAQRTLRAFYRDRVIDTIGADETFVDPVTIYTRIFPTPARSEC